MSILNRGYTVLAITLSIGFFTGTTLAGKTKGGISDQTNNVVTFSKITKINKKVNTIGNNADSAVSTDTTSGTASTTLTPTCDFSGFAQGDLVNRAYAGGTSAAGVTKVNNGIAFTSATVLNTYNGYGEPNSGIVYTSSTSSMVISLENAVPSQVSFAYSSSVALTVSVYSSADGSGTATGSYVANLNVTGTTYNVWSTFTTALASTVRSIKITGAADKFGIDQLVMTVVNPSPTIASVSPTYGSQFGGTAFTLTGTNFTGATSVKIGGVAATNLVVVSATQITAVTPFSSTSGAKDVVVTTPAGSFTAAASFTYTAAVPVLALSNNAGSCNPIGAAINVDATLSGVVSPIVAGQIYITWNPAKMTLNSIEGGDAPFNNLHTINQTAGTALILVSLEQGGSAVSVQSKIVARILFTVAGGSCDGSGTDIQFFPDGTLPTEFTDGVGGKMVPTLIASSGFKVDNVAPVLSPAPADVVVNAGAGMGAFANVALTPPTATDECAPANSTFVYKLVNQAVPNTADGLFYNLVTGAQSTSESNVNTDAPGWDFDSYGSSTNLAFNQNGGSAYFVNSGNYADPYVSKLVQGFLISGALPTKVSGSTPGFNSLMGGDVFVNNGLTGAWRLNSDNIIGFKFTGELNQTLYGWARFSLGANSGVRTFVDYGYDNAGQGVLAGVIPGPSAFAPALTVSSSRNDGQPLGAAFPVGTTTVTWSATDPCGNVTRATTRVTVNNYNTGNFSVSYGGSYPASSSRGLTLDIYGSNARSVSAAFNAGTASFSITDLAIANYDCVSIRDTGHSLRRQVAMSAVGTNWAATTTLIAGDLNSNDVIDVVDWGMYIVGNANADLDGNGVINSYDGAIIIANFGKQSDAICGGALMGPPEPLSSISVSELVDLGMSDLAAADLNNDGWLDMEDVRISGN
jgi:hypothetical protein